MAERKGPAPSEGEASLEGQAVHESGTNVTGVERLEASLRAVAEIGEIARLAGASEIAQAAAELACRVREGRFFVASVGQFKRGKSTLLNALVGERVLPVGVLPVTSAVTVLRHGRERKAVVRFEDGRSEEVGTESVSSFITEQENPKNRRRVSGVEIFLPSPLLESGLSLVDTPGVGSPFASSSERTRELVPELDAALVVLGAEPPLSGEELDLVKSLSREIGEIVFVFGKADRVSSAELEEAARFAREVLSEALGRPVPPLLEVSAEERLQGQATRDWRRLERRLEELSASKREGLLRTAGQRGVRRLSARLAGFLDERIGALERPLEESERRLRLLETIVADARTSLRQLRHLFDSEEQWVEQQVVERGREFLGSVPPEAVASLERAVLAAPVRGRTALRPWACAKASSLSREQVVAWLAREQDRTEEIYRASTDRLVALANEFLDRLARSAPAEAAVRLQPIEKETGFRAASRFVHTDMMHLAPDSLLRRARDAVLPRSLARRLCLRDATRHLLRLLHVNGARAMNDLRERVRESRLSIEADIRTRLEDLERAAAEAVAVARELRAAGQAAVERELARLAELKKRLDAASSATG